MESSGGVAIKMEGETVAPTNGQQDVAAIKMDGALEEHGDVTPTPKAVQDMVNEALESKLQGFQAQMQQMLSLVQGAVGAPSGEPQKVAAPTGKEAKASPTNPPQNDATAGISQVPSESEGGAKEGGTSTDAATGETNETGAERRRRRRQQYLEEVAKMEQEQEEFRRFLEAIAPLLGLPLPEEGRAAGTDGGADGGDAVMGDATIPQEEDTALKDDTASEEDVASKDVNAPADDTAPKDDIDPGDAPLPDGSMKEGPLPLRFPADELVKQSWEKVDGKPLSTSSFHIMKRVCYHWPAEDIDAFGKVPNINPEVLTHLNGLNREMKRKSFSGLPLDVSRIMKPIKEMEHMFRFQQRIHSYASYLVQALGKHINGECSLDGETLSGLLGYLLKGLSDACDTSVLGCVATTKLRRQIYIDSMKIDHPGNAHFSMLNKPLSKDLFPPDMKETLAAHNIVLYTPGSRKRAASQQQPEDLPVGGDAPTNAKRKRRSKKKTEGAEKPPEGAPQQKPTKQIGSLHGQRGGQNRRQPVRKDQHGSPGTVSPARGRQQQGPRQSPLMSQHEGNSYGRGLSGSNWGGQRNIQRQTGVHRPAGMGMSKAAQRRRRRGNNSASSSLLQRGSGGTYASGRGSSPYATGRESNTYAPGRGSNTYTSGGGSGTYSPGRGEYVGSALPVIGSSYGYDQVSTRYRYDDSPSSSFNDFSRSDYSSPSYQDLSRPLDNLMPSYSRSSYSDFSRM